VAPAHFKSKNTKPLPGMIGESRRPSDEIGKNQANKDTTQHTFRGKEVEKSAARLQ